MVKKKVLYKISYIYKQICAYIKSFKFLFFKKIIPTDFIIKDKYNFDVKAKSNKTKIKVVCTNKKSYLIKILLNFLNGDQIKCVLKNPTIPYISYIKFRSRKSITKVNFKNNLFRYQAEKLIKKMTNLLQILRI